MDEIKIELGAETRRFDVTIPCFLNGETREKVIAALKRNLRPDERDPENARVYLTWFQPSDYGAGSIAFHIYIEDRNISGHDVVRIIRDTIEIVLAAERRKQNV
jgi:hypothetical protein